MLASITSSIDIELSIPTPSSPNPGFASLYTIPLRQSKPWTILLDFASSWSTQAFLVDTCLSVSFISYFRLLLAFSTQSTEELKIICEAVHSVADATWPPADLIDLVAVCDTPLNSKFPISSPLSPSTSLIILLVFVVKAISVICFLKPTVPSSSSSSWRTSWLSDTMNGFTTVPIEFSRPFELVVVSVTLHSLLGFTLFPTPLLRASGVMGLLARWKDEIEGVIVVLVAIASFVAIWRTGSCLIKGARRGRIVVGGDIELDDEDIAASGDSTEKNWV